MSSSKRGQDGATGRFVVKVICARNLLAKDRHGFSDPFLKLRLGRAERKTQVLRKTVNPDWQEVFYFQSWPEYDPLRVTCWDYDRVGSHSFLGEVLVPFPSNVRGVVTEEYTLQSNPKLGPAHAQGSLALQIIDNEVADWFYHSTKHLSALPPEPLELRREAMGPMGPLESFALSQQESFEASHTDFSQMPPHPARSRLRDRESLVKPHLNAVFDALLALDKTVDRSLWLDLPPSIRTDMQTVHQKMQDIAKELTAFEIVSEDDVDALTGFNKLPWSFNNKVAIDFREKVLQVAYPRYQTDAWLYPEFLSSAFQDILFRHTELAREKEEREKEKDRSNKEKDKAQSTRTRVGSHLNLTPEISDPLPTPLPWLTKRIHALVLPYREVAPAAGGTSGSGSGGSGGGGGGPGGPATMTAYTIEHNSLLHNPHHHLPARSPSDRGRVARDHVDELPIVTPRPSSSTRGARSTPASPANKRRRGSRPSMFIPTALLGSAASGGKDKDKDKDKEQPSSLHAVASADASSPSIAVAGGSSSSSSSSSIFSSTRKITRRKSSLGPSPQYLPQAGISRTLSSLSGSHHSPSQSPLPMAEISRSEPQLPRSSSSRSQLVHKRSFSSPPARLTSSNAKNPGTIASSPSQHNLGTSSHNSHNSGTTSGHNLEGGEEDGGGFVHMYIHPDDTAESLIQRLRERTAQAGHIGIGESSGPAQLLKRVGFHDYMSGDEKPLVSYQYIFSCLRNGLVPLLKVVVRVDHITAAAPAPPAVDPYRHSTVSSIGDRDALHVRRFTDSETLLSPQGRLPSYPSPSVLFDDGADLMTDGASLSAVKKASSWTSLSPFHPSLSHHHTHPFPSPSPSPLHRPGRARTYDSPTGRLVYPTAQPALFPAKSSPFAAGQSVVAQNLPTQAVQPPPLPPQQKEQQQQQQQGRNAANANISASRDIRTKATATTPSATSTGPAGKVHRKKGAAAFRISSPSLSSGTSASSSSFPSPTSRGGKSEPNSPLYPVKAKRGVVSRSFRGITRSVAPPPDRAPPARPDRPVKTSSRTRLRTAAVSPTSAQSPTSTAAAGSFRVTGRRPGAQQQQQPPWPGQQVGRGRTDSTSTLSPVPSSPSPSSPDKDRP
eukprot:g30265.t1